MDKITLKGITKAYGKNPPVIENLNLDIKDGSFTVLLGPSGCGKSTVLRMIAGLEKTTEGDVLIDGVSVRDVEPGDRNIAMVFQNYALYPTMTVRDNIEFGLKNMKVPQRRTQGTYCGNRRNGRSDRIPRPQTCKSVGRPAAACRAGTGNRQKARSILMDEPLSNLDAKLRTQIRTDLIELHQKLKTTFVYVTHDQIEAMSMGTDIVLLDHGRFSSMILPTSSMQTLQTSLPPGLLDRLR